MRAEDALSADANHFNCAGRRAAWAYFADISCAPAALVEIRTSTTVGGGHYWPVLWTVLEAKRRKVYRLSSGRRSTLARNLILLRGGL